ncbi:hypothetical protein G9A89_000817 [Geosiphon pyriformis]|nr:hypothetical protein G9A89_000817 [Geosiphon pyriformis]
MPKEQNFRHTALSEGRAAAQQQNPSYTPTTIPPARIAENANLSDIFPFEFEANESLFLLSNIAANEQKAITAMYTEAEADKTEQQYFSTNNSLETKELVTPRWNVLYSKPEPQKQCPYIPLKCKDCHKKLSSMGAFILPEEEYENHTCYYCKDNTPCLTCGDTLPEECNWIDVAMRGEVCDQTCQYALSIPEKVKRETPFDAAYNSVLNKLYHYSHDAEMIFDLTMALVNGATKKNVHQMKESDISLPSKSDEYEIEFGEPKAMEEIKTTLIYLIKNQPILQLKYFNNNRQGIKPEKAHEIDAGYDLRYPDKDTLVLKPKSLTKINLKIALEIPPEAMVQITFRFSLTSKKINVREGIIDAGYTKNITVILQNETDKPFKIEHAEKIAQAIYLSLINILEHYKVYICKNSTTIQQIFEFNEQICLEHNISIPNIYVPRGAKKV